jgi:hypothetical protein
MVSRVPSSLAYLHPARGSSVWKEPRIVANFTSDYFLLAEFGHMVTANLQSALGNVVYENENAFDE